MDEVLIPVFVVGVLFLGLPWIIFHYITKWKSAATLTREDEDLLDELHDVARRLDERMCSIERILAAENPNWRAVACDPVDLALEDRRSASTAGLAAPSRSHQPERRAR
ncbi:MAG TPA: envelope stress response membrane protein PspB [Allosphingosinicella sp.]|jgi:phage shock protein B